MKNEDSSLFFLTLSLVCVWLIVDYVIGKKYLGAFLSLLPFMSDSDGGIFGTSDSNNNGVTNYAEGVLINSGATKTDIERIGEIEKEIRKKGYTTVYNSLSDEDKKLYDSYEHEVAYSKD